MTRHFMGDLWFLSAPPSKRNEIYDVISLMQAELQIVSVHMEEKVDSTPKNVRDPLKGIKLVEALLDLYEDRILQAQFSVCAPCVHAIKKAKKRVAHHKSLSREKIPLKIETLHNPFHNSRKSEQTARNLQEKLMEVLKLQNLNFVKKRPSPKLKFALFTTKP